MLNLKIGPPRLQGSKDSKKINEQEIKEAGNKATRHEIIWK